MNTHGLSKPVRFLWLSFCISCTIVFGAMMVLLKPMQQQELQRREQEAQALFARHVKERHEKEAQAHLDEEIRQAKAAEKIEKERTISKKDEECSRISFATREDSVIELY